ncbi:hypothetical protein [Mangrovimonas futianensis]|uniref:hypothetical protein n=1 Tax=Mangrovimonas futianensis TaxID=2895523 RepID=UPI001E33E8EF|nr:hypothetical protein [Mangrovimonas futianensis]MCF1421041.1 hypothetical protein [Mangrovimonas futianensis]
MAIDINYNTYNYKEVNVGKYSTTRHFELVYHSGENDIFSEKIKITNDRGFAKSNPDYWVTEKNDRKWNKQTLSGLFKTDISNIYHGDTKRGKTLLIFEFLKDEHELNLYYVENHTRKDLDQVLNFIFKD